MTKEEAKITGVRLLQDANITLTEAFFTLDEHTSPAFEHELTEIQRRVRDMIVAVERLQ